MFKSSKAEVITSRRNFKFFSSLPKAERFKTCPQMRQRNKCCERHSQELFFNLTWKEKKNDSVMSSSTVIVRRQGEAQSPKDIVPKLNIGGPPMNPLMQS